MTIPEEEVEAAVDAAMTARRLRDKAGTLFFNGMKSSAALMEEAATALESLAARPQTVTEASTLGGPWTLERALEQIDRCEFECEAGPLKNNVAYIWLKSLAAAPPPTSQMESEK